MQFSYVALAALMASVACSQSIEEEFQKLPTCAIPCLTAAVAEAKCGATDYACQCGSGKADITKASIPCIAEKCQPSDIASIQTITTEICNLQAAAGGNSSSASSSASSSGASATPSSTSTSAPSSTSAPAQQSGNAGSKFGTAGAVMGAAVLAAFAL